MTRDDARKLLPDYVRGAIDGAQQHELEALLRIDRELKAEFDQLQKVFALTSALRDVPLEFHADLIDSVMTKIAAEPLLVVSPLARAGKVLAWFILCCLTAAIAVAVLTNLEATLITASMKGLPALVLTLAFALFAGYSVVTRKYRLGTAAFTVCFMLILTQQSSTLDDGFEVVNRKKVEALEEKREPVAVVPPEVVVPKTKEISKTELIPRKSAPAPRDEVKIEAQSERLQDSTKNKIGPENESSGVAAAEPSIKRRAQDADAEQGDGAFGKNAAETSKPVELESRRSEDKKGSESLIGSTYGRNEQGEGNTFGDLGGAAPASRGANHLRVCPWSIEDINWQLPTQSYDHVAVQFAAAVSPFDTNRTFLLLQLRPEQTSDARTASIEFSSESKNIRLVGGATLGSGTFRFSLQREKSPSLFAFELDSRKEGSILASLSVGDDKQKSAVEIGLSTLVPSVDEVRFAASIDAFCKAIMGQAERSKMSLVGSVVRSTMRSYRDNQRDAFLKDVETSAR